MPLLNSGRGPQAGQLLGKTLLFLILHLIFVRKDEKLLKKMNLTNKRHAKHLLAGQNLVCNDMQLQNWPKQNSFKHLSAVKLHIF